MRNNNIRSSSSSSNNKNNKVIVAFKRPKLSVSIIGLVICIVHSILYDFLENKQQKSIFQSIYNYKWDDHDATIEQQNSSSSSFWSTTTATIISASEQFDRYYQKFLEFNNDNNNNNDDDDDFVIQASENNNVSYPFTFGACLQTKDDNLLLPEWLAYHYTVLPLRYLIVAIDPLSLTTPEPIFEKFRSIGMTIEVWTGNWYFTRGRLNKFDPYNHSTLDAFRMHQRRQDAFYTKCLQKFHSYSMMMQNNNSNSNNISWVMLADSDEYLTYNTILPMEQPQKNKQQANNNNKKNIQDDNDPIAIRGRFPTTIGKQNETIAHYMAYYQSKVERGKFSSRILRNDSLCTVFPRLNFVAVDITTIEEGKEDDNGNGKTTTSNKTGQNSIINTTTTTTTTNASSSSSSSSSFSSLFHLPTFDLPPHARRPILPKGGGFDSSQFHTLRYFFHYTYGKNIPGKSIVNVRNLNISQPMNVQNPHRPFKDACDNDAFPTVHTSQKDRKNGVVSPFRFNHYTGSLETFVARPERTVDQWLDRNNLTEKIKDFNYNDYYYNDDHATTTTTTTKKNTVQQQQHSYDESLMEWLPEFARLVGGKEKAFELTQQFRQDALQEWAEIKRMYDHNNKNHTRPPLLFHWD